MSETRCKHCGVDPINSVYGCKFCLEPKKVCKTCKWWGSEHPREYYDMSHNNHLVCECPRNYEAYSDSGACGVGFPEPNQIDTGPDFGCVHHEAKE